MYKTTKTYRTRGFLLSTAIALLFVGVLSFAGCEKAPTDFNKQFDNTNKPITVTVITYPNQIALQRAYGIGRNQVKGFSYYTESGSSCELHVVEPSRVDDENTTSLGHELQHCLYGKFHK